MRPHHLHLEALGPYPGHVHIDFGPLVDEGLFLIHGTTGAGKTFLLDAMTFALFGDVAGARGKNSLVSQHAEPGTEPWAELDFSVGGDRWKVRRVPRHEGRAARGEGLVGRGPTAHLQRFVGGDWVDHPGGLTEVNEKVVELLGLSKDQFQQVVLLPQGDFEQVLRAKDDEREKLLTTLFDTRVFANATYWLERQAKARAAAVEEQAGDMRTLRQRVADAWRNVDPAHATDDSSTTETVSEPAGPSEDDVEAEDVGSDVPADQAALDTVLDRATALVARCDDELAAARAAEDTARAARAAVGQVVDRWDQRRTLQQRRVELDEQRAQVTLDRSHLERALAAEPLRGPLDQEDHLAAQVDALSTAADRATEALRTAWDAAAVLPPSIADLRPDATPSPEALRQLTSELASFRATVDGLAERVDRADKLDAAAAEHERTVEVLGGQLESATTRRAAVVAEREETDGLLTTAERAEASLPGLEAKAAAAAATATAAAELVGAVAALDAARQAEAAARATHDAAVAAADQAQARLLDDMAGALAAALVDGAPCPVCGADEHPAPAPPPLDAPSQKDVERTQKAERKASKELNAASTHLASAEQTVERLRAAAGPGDQDLDGAAAAASDARQEHAAAVDTAAKVGALRARSAELVGDLEQIDASITTLRTDTEAATVAARTARESAATERAAVEGQLGAAEPAAVLKGLDSVRHALVDLDRVAGELRDTSSQLTGVRTQIDQLVGGTEFVDRVAVRGALLDEPVRTQLADRVEAFNSEDAQVGHGLAAEELRELPDERPDLEVPDRALAAAEQVTSAATAARAVAESARSDISGWVEEHRTADSQFADAQAEADLWGTVAKECAGNGRVRVSWQRWMLATYLQEICAFANDRLTGMSSGRYSLQVKPVLESGRAKEGLGLLVYDTHTTAPREVATLSGGETFQASLALALGVADAVTAHAGGINIDTLFVDEGFGTLDPESLELAMDQLEQLRAGGRTVGLISHVGALRERIRTGIKVTSSERGSTAVVGEVDQD